MSKNPPAEMPFRQWASPLLPLLRPFRWPLLWAFLAMSLDALLTALRPWPLKIVIDRVFSQRPTRAPFLLRQVTRLLGSRRTRAPSGRS